MTSEEPQALRDQIANAILERSMMADPDERQRSRRRLKALKYADHCVAGIPRLAINPPGSIVIPREKCREAWIVYDPDGKPSGEFRGTEVYKWYRGQVPNYGRVLVFEEPA